MIVEWLVNFLGLARLIQEFQHYRQGLPIGSIEILEALIAPIFPLCLLAEAAWILWRKRRNRGEISRTYKLPIAIFIFNSVLGIFISLNVMGLVNHFFAKWAVFNMPMKWYWFPLGYAFWELGHLAYHYSSHKVRLLWCFHAPHHAADTMALAVIFNGFYFEYFVATALRVLVPTMLGVPLQMLIFFTILDGCWASLIHISEEAFPSGRIPIFDRIFLSPYRHRIHHARNAEYLDKNFCNTLKLWDWLFGTLGDLRQDVRLEYGIKGRDFRNSFMETYFGEFMDLGRDLLRAGSLKRALQLMIMPPGWGKEGTAIDPGRIR